MAALNCIHILAKYYTYRCLKKEEFPSLAAFKHEVKEFIHLERTIAFKNNRNEMMVF